MNPDQYFFAVPDELDDVIVAGANCGLSQMLFALDRTRLAAGSTLVVQGAGGLGLYAVAIAKERGARVVVVDGVRERLELATRFGAWYGRLLAAGAYLVVIAVVMVLLPTVDETPEPLRDSSGAIIYPGFPADVLYEFRLLSLGAQLVLWMTIGLVFGTLAGRGLGERAGSGQETSFAT